MEDEDEIYENQPQFLAERDVWNRIGGVDIGLGLGGTINLRKSGYTINEQFKLIAAATVKLLGDFEFEHSLSTSGLTHMLSLVEKIPDFEYKNPSAFAFGYIAAINSDYTTHQINKPVLEQVFKINREIEDKLFTKIDDIDIVRYTRLCLLHKLK